MLERKMRILFAINGLGFGNSLRCARLINELLEAEHEVEIICSGNSTKVIKSMFPDLEISVLRQHAYPEKRGWLKLFSLIGWLMLTLKTFFDNRRVIESQFQGNEHDLVVCDSSYDILFVKRDCPLVFLSHVAWTHQMAKDIGWIRKAFTFSYYIELLDNFLLETLADFVVAPVVNPKEFAEFCNEKRVITSAFVDSRSKSDLVTESTLKTDIAGRKSLVFVSSGCISEIYTRILDSLVEIKDYEVYVVGIELSEYSDRLRFIAPRFDSDLGLEMFDVVISNAGYITLSESIFRGRPQVFVPFDNHLEQMTNCLYVERQEIGKVASPESFNEDLIDFTKNYGRYLSNIERIQLPGTGAKEAREFLETLGGDL